MTYYVLNILFMPTTLCMLLTCKSNATIVFEKLVFIVKVFGHFAIFFFFNFSSYVNLGLSRQTRQSSTPKSANPHIKNLSHLNIFCHPNDKSEPEQKLDIQSSFKCPCLGEGHRSLDRMQKPQSLQTFIPVLRRNFFSNTLKENSSIIR